jgi:hypothetical protein
MPTTPRPSVFLLMPSRGFSMRVKSLQIRALRLKRRRKHDKERVLADIYGMGVQYRRELPTVLEWPAMAAPEY